MSTVRKQSVLFRVPVIGYALRCFAEERMAEIALLIVNFVMAVAVVVLISGYPGLITTALATAVLAGLLVFSSTRG